MRVLNKLPTTYQSIHYVYTHTDPETGEIVYIGKGSRGRAWHCAEYNNRSVDHAAFLNDLINLGFTPDSWVTIIEAGLSSRDAYKLEADLIWGLDSYPKYNAKRDASCKLTSDDLTMIRELRSKNNSYEVIGAATGFSTMTIYRALNGQTKNYK